MADRTSLETDHQIELRTRDRERKLIGKFYVAANRGRQLWLLRKDEEPIGLRRLEARPIAAGLEAQGRHERLERTYRDD